MDFALSAPTKPPPRPSCPRGQSEACGRRNATRRILHAHWHCSTRPARSTWVRRRRLTHVERAGRVEQCQCACNIRLVALRRPQASDWPLGQEGLGGGLVGADNAKSIVFEDLRNT